MSDKRFTLEDRGYDGFDIYDSTGEYKESELFIGMSLQQIVDCLNKLNDENEQLKHYKLYEDNKRLQTIIADLKEENERLRMKLKGDDYIMVSEMLSNLRKTGICDGCKNKDKPVEWYLERGFSITGRVCDRYEPEV